MSIDSLFVMGERFEGALDKDYDAKLVNIRKADNHKGLLILDFATPQGPLPMYCHGDIIDSSVIVRSNLLVGLNLTTEDIGSNSFVVTSGRRQKRNGSYGNPCVTGITRKVIMVAKKKK